MKSFTWAHLYVTELLNYRQKWLEDEEYYICQYTGFELKHSLYCGTHLTFGGRGQMFGQIKIIFIRVK